MRIGESTNSFITRILLNNGIYFIIYLSTLNATVKAIIGGDLHWFDCLAHAQAMMEALLKRQPGFIMYVTQAC